MEQKLPKRSEVAVEQTWKLEDVYPDVQVFEEDLKRGLALADEIAGYEGKLGDGAEVLLKVYELYQECKKTDYRFFGYAMMRSDVDTGNADNLALLQKAQSADVKILEKTAFIEPEVLALGEEKMNAYYESCPALRAFKITIDDAIRLAPHTLNKSDGTCPLSELLDAAECGHEVPDGKGRRRGSADYERQIYAARGISEP